MATALFDQVAAAVRTPRVITDRRPGERATTWSARAALIVLAAADPVELVDLLGELDEQDPAGHTSQAAA